jgi:hypothetical protein
MKAFKLEENLKIDSGFQVPEKYFDDLENNILDRLSKDDTRVISVFRRSYFWFSGVAAILVIGLSISVLFQNAAQTSYTNEDYLFTHENLNTEDFVEFLSENDLQTLEKSIKDFNLKNKKTVNENL